MAKPQQVGGLCISCSVSIVVIIAINNLIYSMGHKNMLHNSMPRMPYFWWMFSLYVPMKTGMNTLHSRYKILSYLNCFFQL